MISKTEVKTFVVAVGKRWLFPDFTNRLTWFVVSIGSAVILTPSVLKLVVLNWVVDTIKLNSGAPFTLAEVQTGYADYVLGFALILLALAHNIANRCFLYLTTDISAKEEAESRKVDIQLFNRFLAEFPSAGSSVSLLKEQDFGNSYHKDSTIEMDNFVNNWNTAQTRFLDNELDELRSELWQKLREFVNMLAGYSGNIGAGPMLSAIPGAYQGLMDWPAFVDVRIKELNQLATECYELHQNFILKVRRKLKC